MRCTYHPEADAVGACVQCRRLVCTECKVELGGKIYCNPCAEEILLDRARREESKPAAGIIAEENTSGQGKLAVVPQGIRGWNWGAFLLSWIWGVGNNVWWSLLGLIPYFNIVWAFVLGVKGTEWAWRNKKWDSIEHFKRTQRKWAYWGAGVAGVLIILMIIITLSG